MSLQALPADLIKPVLEQLVSRVDLCNCALVSQEFHRTAAAVLYRNLEIRNVVVRETAYGELEVVHPCTTILLKPWYAKYVQHITESPIVASLDPVLVMDILAALRLCTNLQSFSLGSTKHICVHRVDQMLSNYLRVLQRLRVPKISIYSQSSLSPQVLTSLMYMNDVKEIEVHTIGGGFVRAEAMAAALRRRVTHLAFTVSPDEKVSYTAFFQRIPRLKSLFLRGTGVGGNNVLEMLSVLPDLVSLDTHYAPLSGQETGPLLSKPICHLHQLKVRCRTWEMKKMWSWLSQLTPYSSSLETLHIQRPTGQTASTLLEKHFQPVGMTLPSRFLRRMAGTHGPSLKRLIVDVAELTGDDFNFVCENFSALECLAVMAQGRCIDLIDQGVRKARGLRFLGVVFRSDISLRRAKLYAEQWMDRGSSKLTTVIIRDHCFEGKWVYEEGTAAAKFEITHSIIKDGLYPTMSRIIPL